MDLSIIIVNYNTRELLLNAIKSIYSTIKNVDFEIIVIDNASVDDSVKAIKEHYSNVLLIKNKTNDGFAKANNKGIEIAKGEYILLLNSDTILIGDCIEKCIKYMNCDDTIGALGCKVLLPDGSLDKACKRGYPTPEASLYYMLKLDKLFPKIRKFGEYNLTYLDENEINEVDSLVGAFMLVRSSVINKIGMLDEEFFMYGEDIDWCKRIKDAGWKIIYYPSAQIIHYKGASSKKKRTKIIYEFHRAMFLFYKKHYKKKYNLLITLLVYIGIALKLGFSLLINLLRRRK